MTNGAYALGAVGARCDDRAVEKPQSDRRLILRIGQYARSEVARARLVAGRNITVLFVPSSLRVQMPETKPGTAHAGKYEVPQAEVLVVAARRISFEGREDRVSWLC